MSQVTVMNVYLKVPVEAGDGHELHHRGSNSLANRQTSRASRLSSIASKDEEGNGRYLVSSGTVSFWNGYAYDKEIHPYVVVSHDINMEEIDVKVFRQWKLQRPRIVLVVVSNVAPLHAWKNLRQLENFQKGLIKATNTTAMWVLTHGINIGIAQVVGEAFREETNKRQALRCHKHPNQNAIPLPRLTLIGTMREDLLVYSEKKSGKMEVENEGNRPEDNKYELNPDHSHYIMVKDDTITKTGLIYFLLKLEQYIVGTDNIASQATRAAENAVEVDNGEECFGLGDSGGIPVVALLVQGGYECARMIQDHLKKQMPVVVIRGSGGLADLLAYAHLEIQNRCQGRWNTDYIENYLKPELSSKISQEFSKLRDNNLARNTFRSRILECIRLARQNKVEFMTILNLHSQTCNLQHLDQYLLKALFKSQEAERTNLNSQIRKDLLLTIDWNCPQVAMSEVFQKYPSNTLKIDKQVFEVALLRTSREEFVDLFLEQGFQIQRYLSRKRLRNLFKRVKHQEFFLSVCWEGVLGHLPDTDIARNFIEEDLNWMIELMTGFKNYVNAQDLDLGVVGTPLNEPSAAERKALAILCMWAIFTNRCKLAQLMWKHCDQPIHLALVLAMILDSLQTYVPDSSLKVELGDFSKRFTDMAVGVLDASYRDASCRSYDVLSEESGEWMYKTAVEIAADSRNRSFLAHPCCQKWLTNMFYGNIRIRELPWGVMTIPQWLKVLLCAFTVAPMYMWVRFIIDPTKEGDFRDVTELDSEDEKEEVEDDSVPILTAQLKKKSLNIAGVSAVRTLRPREVFIASPPYLWKMIFLMWSAPITKFWVYQVFYIFYLVLFCMAVLWPSCGNWYLDTMVCSWTALLTTEATYRTYMLSKRYSSIPLFFKCVEILMLVIFVVFYAMERVIRLVDLLDPYHVKVLLCIALLYFFFRQIAIYLPISPTLGPLLYRLRLMVLVDFTNFMRMTLLVIISNGVALQAVLYPDHPINSEMFRMSFHRAWFSLFLTPVDELQGKAGCLRLSTRRNDTCYIGKYEEFDCPNIGIWPYIFAVEYFVLLKLILMTLLFALFSSTASKLVSEPDVIWKFQRYQLVIDFATRLRLPAPLNIFSYVLMVTRVIGKYLRHCFTCRPCRKGDQTDTPVLDPGSARPHRLSRRDFSYWRNMARVYSNDVLAKTKEEKSQKEIPEKMEAIAEDVEYEKQLLRGLRGQVKEMTRMLNSAFTQLESLKNSIDKSSGEFSVSQNTIHVLSRNSPYPGTQVQRYPVPNKYVPWEVMWVDYDPVAYTRQKADFPITLQQYVDEDILLLQQRHDAEAQSLPVLRWNMVSTNAAGISIDRTSWMAGDAENIIYKLDTDGLPRNPSGRTGLLGRGNLPRWGPNHYILIVITRWQKPKVATTGGIALEFVVSRAERRDQFSLPGGFVPGDQKYEAIHALFKPQEAGPAWKTEEEMSKFFRDCYQPPTPLETGDEEPQPSLEMTVEMVRRGYMDDPWNTDQAWREVELWHVHYPSVDTLADKLQAKLGWRVITEDVFIRLPTGQAVLLQEITNKLRPTIL